MAEVDLIRGRHASVPACALFASIRAALSKGVESWFYGRADGALRDPDGNRLCLFHAGENRLNPPWRIPG